MKVEIVKKDGKILFSIEDKNSDYIELEFDAFEAQMLCSKIMACVQSVMEDEDAVA